MAGTLCRLARCTGVRRMSGPMNRLNSAGEISPEPFEPRHFGAAQIFQGRVPLAFGIAVYGFLRVAHAEQRRFEDVHESLVHDRFEEAEEKRQEQVADVQPVHVRVRREDDLAVAQAFERILDVEAAHQVVQLLVLVHHVALQVAHVQRLAAHGENRLGVDVAAADDGSGGRLAFGDEDHRVVAMAGALVVVSLAVLELRDADGGGARPLAGHLFDGLKLLAQLDRLLDFDQSGFGRFGVAVEQIDDDLAHLGDQFAAQFGVAQLVFGLRFEDRLLQADGDCAGHAFPDVVPVEFRF